MKAYITHFAGLGNRLETLITAHVIRERFGHEICLDWPELDTLQIPGTRRAKLGLFARFAGLRLGLYQPEIFSELGKRRHVIVRGLYGAPSELLDVALPHVAASVALHPVARDHVKSIFAKNAGPVVGVHLRRGDFNGGIKGEYGCRTKHFVLQDAWVLHVMEKIRTAYPGVRFFLSYTGDIKDYARLTERFGCFDIGLGCSYSKKKAGHASAMNPAADLFALACCNVIIATPNSSFSHWAANVLGRPSTTLMPSFSQNQDNPGILAHQLGQVRLPLWVNAGKTGTNGRPVERMEELPAPEPAFTQWL